MKRSITKSLKRRIEQSSRDLIANVFNDAAVTYQKEHARAMHITGSRLQSMFKKFCIFLAAAFVLCCLCLFATSCNVTRTITNESQYYQRGDTSVVIQTKTIETYDASKKL